MEKVVVALNAFLFACIWLFHENTTLNPFICRCLNELHISPRRTNTAIYYLKKPGIVVGYSQHFISSGKKDNESESYFCKNPRKKWNEPLLTVLFLHTFSKLLHQVTQHQHLPIHIHRSSFFPCLSSSISFYAGSFVRTHAIFLIYYPFPALLS